ncbi:MAG: glycosyltransferase [Pseudomonadota bacterium]
MIFLTVGTQLPFDRLVRLVDEWAAKNPQVDVFAQIASGNYLPKHMQYVDYLEEPFYSKIFNQASNVVAHAGMGTIINSLLASKPVIVFPRKASLGEHRNEHQLATCHKLSVMKGCYIAYEEDDLFESLDNQNGFSGGSIAPYANDRLINTIDRFIAGPG